MQRRFQILLFAGVVLVFILRFDIGVIPEKDISFRVDAENGDAFAQTQLGQAYLFGEDIEQDEEMGLYWLERAAKADEPQANYLLGSLIEQGRISGGDLKLAERYYRRAAMRNNAAAQESLARIYAEPTQLGPPDFVESHKWQILANAHGWRLQAIDYGAAQWLTAQQLAASEAAAAALQAKFGNL